MFPGCNGLGRICPTARPVQLLSGRDREIPNTLFDFSATNVRLEVTERPEDHSSFLKVHAATSKPPSDAFCDAPTV